MSDFDFITREVKEAIKGYTPAIKAQAAGRIVSCNDGVILIDGLKNVKNNELVYLGGENYALALNLEEKLVGAIVLAGTASAGDIAYTTGRIVSIPVGRALLGRVVDPLGNPLDGEAYMQDVS